MIFFIGDKMLKKIFISAIVFPFIFLTATTCYSQKISFSAKGGVSKAVGKGNENWNLGLSVGSNIFFYLNQNIVLGGRLAYNRWTPNEKLLTSAYNDVILVWNISGSASFLEIVPSIRILTSIADTKSINI